MTLRITDAVDLHCHYSPDTIGGSLEFGDAFHAISALTSAQEARDNGYAAIVLKSHAFANPAVAQNIAEAVPGLQVFGGICTDHPTGGLNVWAVEAALSIGAKIVWLPTVHSTSDYGRQFEIAPRHQHLGPVHVLDEDGNILPQVHEIFDLVKTTDAVLATGHISRDEHFAVVKEFGRSGKVLVTHAGEARTGNQGFSPAHCVELADLGATIEITALSCDEMFGEPGRSPEELSAILSAVGPARCTLSTDYGWSGPPFPRPVAGFYEFMDALWRIGVPEADLVTMASTNPAALLGLPYGA